MERALSAGHFLDYSAPDEKFVSSPLHRAIASTVRDVQVAKAVLNTENDWRSALMTAASQANARKRPVVVSAGDVLWALAYVDRADNAFYAQRALASFLLGKSSDPGLPTGSRRPESPVEDAIEGLWRERVEPDDVRHLLTADIYPFGARLPSYLVDQIGPEQMRSEIAQEVRAQARSDDRGVHGDQPA